MKAQALSNTLVCEGILDEQTEAAEIQAVLDGLKKSAKPPIDVDFSKVKYANSTGIVTWLKIVKATGVPFRYVNAPVWLVGQFNMIRNFFENGSYVQSIGAPYFCPSTQESRVLQLSLGKEVPIKSDYTDLQMPAKAFEGKTYEIDFVPARYFSFISENFTIFKEKFP